MEKKRGTNDGKVAKGKCDSKVDDLGRIKFDGTIGP